VDPSSGRVRLRTIPASEISEIITDPEDAKTPWLYKRTWSERTLNLSSGRSKLTPRTLYYPAWRYVPDQKPKNIGSVEVQWDAPVYHVKTGGFSDWKFGCSEVYAAIDWARAYKEFLEDWASLTRSYSRFAWRLTSKGGKAGVAAAKKKLESTLGTGSGGETNPPPVAGSTFIGGEGYDLQPFQLRGANISAEDGRRLLLMVASSVGLPETYFGDVSVGTLATAKTMDRPTELMMRERQTFWMEVIRDIFLFVLTWAVKAQSGKLKDIGKATDQGIAWNEDVDAHLDIDFPPILERDVQAAVQAVVTALTLNGQQFALLNEPLATRLILKALAEDDIDEIMSDLFPDETKNVAKGEPGASEARMVEAARRVVAAIREQLSVNSDQSSMKSER